VWSIPPLPLTPSWHDAWLSTGTVTLTKILTARFRKRGLFAAEINTVQKMSLPFSGSKNKPSKKPARKHVASRVTGDMYSGNVG
jgi:hypothetical protein